MAFALRSGKVIIISKGRCAENLVPIYSDPLVAEGFTDMAISGSTV